MADIDRDEDQDILLGTIWLENTEAEWLPHTLHITDGEPYGESNPDRNRLADINQDDRLDAIIGYEAISVEGKLAWYEQGIDATAIWQEHVISNVVGPMSLDVEDIDLDGDFDIIAGEHNLIDPSSAKLIVFENVNGVGTQWQERLIYQGDEHHDGAEVDDIDGDGNLDVISIGWDHSSVLLYRNLSDAFLGPFPYTLAPTSFTPTPHRTIVSVTSKPVTPNEPILCFAGLLFPAGILFASLITYNLIRKRS